jgi:hypothetical protein
MTAPGPYGLPTPTPRAEQATARQDQVQMFSKMLHSRLRLKESATVFIWRAVEAELKKREKRKPKG